MSTLPEFAETSRKNEPQAVQVEVATEKETNQELAERTEPNSNEDPIEVVCTLALHIPI